MPLSGLFQLFLKGDGDLYWYFSINLSKFFKKTECPQAHKLESIRCHSITVKAGDMIMFWI